MDDEGWNSDDQYDYYDDDSRYDDSGRYSNWSDVIDQDSSSNNGSSWGNKMQERAERRKSAKAASRDVENGASKKGGNSSFMTAVQNAREAEAKGEFKNNVEGKMLEKANRAAKYASPGASLLLDKVRKGGPFASILLIVAVLISIFAGTQSLAPFGLVANGLDQFNNLRTSMNKRTTYFSRFSLDKTRNIPATKKATIFSPEKFKVSKSLKKKLGKQNIFYFGEKDGYSVRFLVYEDKDTHTKYAVTANEGDLDGLPDRVRVNIDGEDIDLDISRKIKLDDALLESDNFARSFDVGTRTLKGHVAGWFDSISETFHFKRIKNSRNRFRNASETASDEEIKQRAKTEGMDEKIRGTDAESNVRQDVEDGVDDEGNRKWRDEEIFSDGHVDDGIGKLDNLDDIDVKKAEVKAKFEAKAKAITGAMGLASGLTCGAIKVFSAINIMVGAMHVANVINYVSGFLEAIQKTQSGDAGRNELAFYMNSLSEKGNTYANVDDKKAGINPIREGTSSLESPAWNQFFSSGDVVVQSNDPLAVKFNRDYVAAQAFSSKSGVSAELAGAIGNFTNSIEAYKGCLYAQAGVALAGIVVDAVLAFMTVGIGALVKSIVQDFFEAAALQGLVAVIMGAVSLIIPHVVSWLAMDLIEDMAGEDAAYAINSGFNIYLGGQMQMSSGLPAKKDTLMAHWRAQQEVIASEGALERSMRSPFDPTSKYTFLGSIVNSLMPIANTWSSPLTTVSKTVNTVGSSLMSLRPTANAEGEAEFETSINEDCPTLSQIGVVGDAYCNPYFVTDMSTMSADPSEVIDMVSYDTEKSDNPIDGNFLWNDPRGDIDTDGDGVADAYNPPINPEGELAKWTIACAKRDSQYGVIDSNVIAAIQLLPTSGNDVLDTAVSVGVGSLPFVGDAVDIAQAAREAENTGWSTGENCVSDDYEYYSRYSEDQRMLESMGLVEESAVSQFLREYYEENPVDDSLEGTIARYSGMTVDEVNEAFDMIAYMNFIAEYNPEEYGPAEFAPKPDGSYQYESNDIIAKKEQVIVGRYVIYDDLRTKIKVA
jgi:hypothetical protein